MRYKAIGFDYGGVINGKPGSYFDKAVCELLNVTEEDYKRVYFSHNRKFNAGKPISEQELWKLILNDLNKSDKLESVMRFVVDMRVAKQTNREVLELVDTLRTKGYKAGLLSNNSQQAADKMRADGLDKHFDAFIVSAEVGVMKPDPAIFNLFAERLEVELPELVFIDDSKRSLSASEECGFVPVLFESHERLLENLKSLTVLTSAVAKNPL